MNHTPQNDVSHLFADKRKNVCCEYLTLLVRKKMTHTQNTDGSCQISLCTLYSSQGKVWRGMSLPCRRINKAESEARMDTLSYLDQSAARKERNAIRQLIAELPDTFLAWIECYLDLTVVGVRPEDVAKKITLHLSRFAAYFAERYGHEQLSHCLKRDVQAWQTSLAEDWGMAPATVNNHLASLSAFCTWVHAQNPQLFAAGDPTKGVRELPLPPLEPRTLSEAQVRSLKSVLDRLPSLYEKKGRRYQQRTRKQGTTATRETHGQKRPYRDRAILYVMLSTGVRREELLNLNLAQVEPNTPHELRIARRARIIAVKGKNRSQRTLYLSKDAREALADYLERERPMDVRPGSIAVFLSAVARPAQAQEGQKQSSDEQEGTGGRLACRTLNHLFEKIGRLHDGEISDPQRHISPFYPHALRHTFGNTLSKATQADEYELERRLGHRSKRYIGVYTNPTPEVAAGYIEPF